MPISGSADSSTSKSEVVFEVLIIILVIWLAHFFHVRYMGLYEDDWTRIPDTVGMSWHELLHTLKQNTIVAELSQGRPLHPIFVYTFSWIGLRSGSLVGVFAIGFLFQITNALLFHALLTHIFHDRRFAFLGTIALCLYPADTTQPFLTHALGVQPALTLLLIASHLYFCKKEVLSYVFIFLVLFSYETPYLIFAAAPMLENKSRRAWYKHWVILFGLLLLALIIRKLGGEERVETISVKTLLIGGSNVVTGPLTAIAMYIYRPLEAPFHLNVLNFFITSMSILLFFWIIMRRLPAGRSKDSRALPLLGTRSGRTAQLRTGLLLLFLAYPLTFTTKGISISGRGTRVHFAASLGAAILFAWFCCKLLDRAERSQTRIPKIALAVVFGFLIGFGLVVQQDYQKGWEEQREFWTDMVAIVPPLRDGDVVMLDPAGLRDTRQLLFLRKDLTGYPDTRQIRSLDNVVHGLQDLFVFRSDSQKPAVFRLPKDWEKTGIFTANDELNLRSIEIPYYFDPESRGPVDPSQIVFIDTADGRLSRRKTLVNPINGHTLQLNSSTGTISNMPRKPFYPLVIYPSNPQPYGYLVK